MESSPRLVLPLPDLEFQAGADAEGLFVVSHWADMRTHPRVPLVVRRERYAQGATTGMHRHDDFLALYAVRGGRAWHVVNGEAFPVARGDLYLLHAGATHGYTRYQQLEIDAFYFTMDVFTHEETEALQALPMLWSLLSAQDKTPPRFHLNPDVWSAVEAGVEELRAEWCEGSLAGAILLRGGFFRLLVRLAREYGSALGAARVPTKTPGAPVVAALRALEANPARAWTVAELAAGAFLSSSHFSELFAREVGMPPATYLKRLRLDQARTLLRTTALPLSRIALDCGFADGAHFSRAFRGAYGQSPSQFRRHRALPSHTS